MAKEKNTNREIESRTRRNGTQDQNTSLGLGRRATAGRPVAYLMCTAKHCRGTAPEKGVRGKIVRRSQWGSVATHLTLKNIDALCGSKRAHDLDDQKYHVFSRIILSPFFGLLRQIMIPS